MSLIIQTTNAFKDRLQDFLKPHSTSANQTPFNMVYDKALQIHGELQSHLCVYLNPKSVELCSKLLYAIPITLILNTLTIPQTLIVSAIGSACLWSCKKEFITRDSKINLLHSIAIVFFANMISFSTELSTALFLKLPVNAALLIGSLCLADQLEGKIKHEPKIKYEPVENYVKLEPNDVVPA